MPSSPNVGSLKERFGALRTLRPFIAMVWRTSPHLTVLSLMLAYRLGARLAGPLAGAVAALSLALSADLYRTALLGSAEPVLIALTLGAAGRHLAGRCDWALVLIAVAGLIRPEAWVLLGAYGIFVWLREPRLRPLVAVAVVLPPAVWLGLDWIGSGDPLHASSTATSATEGSAANAPTSAGLASQLTAR